MKFAMTNSAMKDETKLHSQGAFHVYNMPKLRQGRTCLRCTSLIMHLHCQICRQ